MTAYTTTVTIPVRIDAPDFDTATKLAETAADTALAGIDSHLEIAAQAARIEPLHRVYTRQRAAIDAVRAAMTQTLVPHALTRTVPHVRQIRDLGLKAGVTLTDDEIHAALVEVMDR